MKFIKYIFKVTVLLSTFISIKISYSHAKACNFTSKNFQNKLENRFGQNPVKFVETFANNSHKLLLNDIDKLSTTKLQNEILNPSFDLVNINKSLIKNLKTRSITRYFMDWIRTQYWGNIDQLYFEKEKSLKYFITDMISTEEINLTQLNPVFTKTLKLTKRKCSRREKDLDFCPGAIYEAHVQFSPFISCRQKVLNKPFKGIYSLSYKKNQGFKIIDIELSGKRLVLSSLDYLALQKRKGLSSTALTSQIKLLSSHAGTFSLPGVIPHSNKFLAKFNTPSPRLPASL